VPVPVSRHRRAIATLALALLAAVALAACSVDDGVFGGPAETTTPARHIERDGFAIDVPAGWEDASEGPGLTLVRTIHVNGERWRADFGIDELPRSQFPKGMDSAGVARALAAEVAKFTEVSDVSPTRPLELTGAPAASITYHRVTGDHDHETTLAARSDRSYMIDLIVASRTPASVRAAIQRDVSSILASWAWTRP
jgi:hypothetical protein